VCHLRRLGWIAATGLLLSWPAIFNGYPLLFPDSGSFLLAGRLVWTILLTGRNTWFYSDRSELYGAGIYLMHWGLSPWPIVFGQAFLVAWMLWLLMRSLLPVRPERSYVVLMVVLSGFSSVAWYVSWPMPDILGPLVYLAVLLLLFGRTALDQVERGGVVAIGVWGITAHASHLVIVAGLLGLLGLLWCLRWRPLQRQGFAVAWIASMMTAALLLQTAVHARMYGKFSLDTPGRPPFLMARLTADGPARDYLRTHCPALGWTLCRYQDKLTKNELNFLWSEGGVWQNATPSERRALRQEELPLALATLRTHPLQQLRYSAINFVHQLKNFGQYNFFPIRDAKQWLAETFSPSAVAAYEHTRQAHRYSLPRWFNRMLDVVLGLSVGSILWLIRRVWGDPRFQLLTVVVGFTVVFNAAATATLAGVSWRYQGRVVWMVVLVALLMVLRVWNGSPRTIQDDQPRRLN
jgi:hypothetical protein